jgi:uncharacterized protein
MTLKVPRIPSAALPSRGFGGPDAAWRTATLRTKDGVTLQSWFVRPIHPTGACVVVLHGIADSKSGSAGFAPMFLAEGYSVLLPDSRGHGASGGEQVTYGLLEKYDVLEWAHWMRKQGCTRLYGLGESLGASILIQAAAVEPQFQALVAECPYSDLRAVAEYRVGRMSNLPSPLAAPLAKVVVASALFYARLRYALDLNQVSPISSIRRTSTPILLIHGLQDTKTPYWHSQALAQASSHTELWLVRGADHVGASSADPKQFHERVLGWFARYGTHLPRAALRRQHRRLRAYNRPARREAIPQQCPQHLKPVARANLLPVGDSARIIADRFSISRLF